MKKTFGTSTKGAMILNFEHQNHPARPPPGGLFLCHFFRKDEVNTIAKRENILTLSLPFPDEKIQALTHFLEENGEDLERCMVESVEQLYRKTVPVAIRKYIDATLKKQEQMSEGSTRSPTGEG